MIPALVDGRLPAGEWTADWNEVEETFGTSSWRLHLLDGCRRALVALKAAGCRRAWIDGSFVSGKLHPGDVDGCYDPIGVDRALLHPALLDLSPGRPAQKAEFGCEFFPNIVEAGSGEYFVEFFNATVMVNARESSSSTWRSSNHDQERTAVQDDPQPSRRGAQHHRRTATSAAARRVAVGDA